MTRDIDQEQGGTGMDCSMVLELVLFSGNRIYPDLLSLGHLIQNYIIQFIHINGILTSQ